MKIYSKKNLWSKLCKKPTCCNKKNLFSLSDLLFFNQKISSAHFVLNWIWIDFEEVNIHMNWINPDRCMERNVYLLLGVNWQSLQQLKMVHLLNRFLYHSKSKMKGFAEFLYSILFYDSNCIFELTQWMTSAEPIAYFLTLFFSLNSPKSGLLLSISSIRN